MAENMVECTAGPLELRTMGDACPRCGGTDYYCAEEVDRHIEHLPVEFNRAQVNLDEARRQLCENRAEKWRLENEVETLRAALQWIVDHDQTEKPNGGDPEWFAEQAPIRARKALGL